MLSTPSFYVQENFHTSFVYDPSQAFYNSFTIIYTSIILVLPLLNPRFGLLTKSDIDFLLQLPVSQKQITISLTISSTLINLLLFYILLPIYANYGDLLASIEIIVLLSLLTRSLPILVYKFTRIERALLIVILLLWFNSGIFGLPISPLLALYSRQQESLIILAVFTVAVAILSIYRFNLSQFINMYEGPKESTIIKNSISFKNLHPFLAFLKKNLIILELGGRAYTAFGVPTFLTKRIEIWKILPLTILIALTLAILSKYHIIPDLFLTRIFLVLSVLSIASLLTSSIFIMEPIWLYATIFSPLRLARYLLFSKALTVIILLIPFISVFPDPRTILMVLLNIPSFTIFSMAINARFYPQRQQQIPTLNLGSLLVSIVMLLPIVFLMTIYIIPSSLSTFIVASVIYSTILALPIIISQGYWKKTIEKNIIYSS
ncbi:hypothetical protein SUSAZ_06195 [Sulfolobus acidocaldarius SUSAZ]|nr:hypothetical protein SUSAZ_06195 [Sulfolobus acidocaldarius SUSAZ]